MHNSKLIDIHKTLSAQERRKFSEYIYSPLFNKHEKLVKLIDIITEEAPLYKGNALARKNIFHRLFPKEKYKEEKVSVLMTYMVTHIEYFLAYLNYDKHKTKKQLHLLAELRERNMDDYFKRNLSVLKTTVDSYPYRNDSHYMNEYLMESESDIFFAKKESRQQHDSIQKKADSLTLFYLSSNLKNWCEMMNRKNIIAAEYDLGMLNDAVKYIKDNSKKLKDIPAIMIYYRILLTLTESGKEEHYTALKEILHKNSNKFSQEEARQMYDYAQNYCIKKINGGNTSYLKELFSLYKLLLENKIIFEEQYLPQWDYKNIVSLGLRIEEYVWIEKFIHQYKEKIAPEFRENAYVYNLAYYYYSKQEYKNALKLLQEIEFTDVFYNIDSKSMLLKIYYELEETESFYSLIDAFKMFLKRNKLISDYQYQANWNLTRLAKKIYRIRATTFSTKKDSNKKKIEEVRTKIKESKSVANVNWLNQKLEELER